MKPGPRAFAIEWSVHTWVGLVTSLVGFVFFAAGTVAIFRDELEVWLEPALMRASEDLAAPSLEQAERAVEAAGLRAGARRLVYRWSPATRFVQVTRSDATGAARTVAIDPLSGAWFDRSTHLADDLVELHFFGHLPGGPELSGLFAVALLVVTLSGFVIHLKDLVAQWWRFRSTERLRLVASDAHKVLGVFGAPFAVAMAWSGVLLTVAALLGGAVGLLALRGDARRLDALAGLRREPVDATQRPGTEAPLDARLAVAQQAAQRIEPPRLVIVEHPGDAASRTRCLFPGSRASDDVWVEVNSATTALNSVERGPKTAFAVSTRLAFDVHFARYGGLAGKWLSAALGLAGCVVILTGTLIWLERRRRTRDRRSHQLARLTAGVAVGFPLGLACSLLACRLLPPGGTSQGFSAFLAGWFVGALVVVVLGVRRPSGGVLLATGIVFAMLPGLDFVQGVAPWRVDPASRAAAFTLTAVWLICAWASLVSGKRLSWAAKLSDTIAATGKH
jgi:uncharacterized iron-regulated membrane protein